MCFPLAAPNTFPGQHSHTHSAPPNGSHLRPVTGHWFRFSSGDLLSFLGFLEACKMGDKQENDTLVKVKPSSEQDISDELDQRIKKYLRGEGANLENLQDRKLKGQLAVREDLYGKSAKAAAKAEKWLMPSEAGYLEADGIEKTWRIKQTDLVRAVDISSSRNQYDIVLPELGPYILDFTLSGRYMVIGGRKGHLGIVDMMKLSLIKEFQVRETVRDVVFLHNELFFAAAQKKYPYIYNRDGTELHCLKEHGAVLRLQFLKNHFLLASINKFGQLHYQDVTTGVMAGNFRTGMGRTNVMQVNPFNGVVALGHSSGTVTMWKPTSSAPLIKMLCHHGPVSALAFHSNGHLMATAGKDKKIKLWDLRKFEVLQTVPGHANTLDFSQKGLLACGTGSFIQVLNDSSGTLNYSRYMNHSMAKGYQVGKLLFRPYEDVLGIGHSMGWSSILIPGSGEPNFDSWVANPFETSKQRREKEVHSLLDKLPPETIMLDPSKIGTLKPTKNEQRSKQEREAEMEEAIEAAKGIKLKKKTKGRNKASKRMQKKQEMIEKVRRPYLEQKTKEEEQFSRKKQKVSEEIELPKSLQRFASKKGAS
ncbi:hypothetical protein L6164_006876 [Bauhinia variegata]|uniref:Uncharacterized protein n=1 Tax=Bauhinia variegata TaxID=167791 RepID=A0ACB9PV73_BAUVA|nr:hypothetical protein L6164_006876 [Bauhinia variegata]